LIRVYRVLRKAFAQSPFDGEGAYLYGGRWSSPGTRLCYTSEHQSLAMLEYFVHLDAEVAPPDLVLVTADIPDGLPTQRIAQNKLPSNWRSFPAPAELARIGDEFVRRGSCLLIVPSALAPYENNSLLNPQHPGFRRVKISAPEPLTYDARMFASRQARKKASS
jgi:RES domain-containing protein